MKLHKLLKQWNLTIAGKKTKSIRRYMVSLLTVLAILAMTGTAQAGTIYTDEASFNANMAGLNLLWEEDFYYNGYQGPVPNPGQIAGGQAELLVTPITATTSILFPASFQYVSQGATLIQGVGGADLGVAAISFNFGNFIPPGQEVIFNLVGGGSNSSTGGLYPSVGDLFGRPSGAIYFAGWIGTPGELLSNVSFVDGVILDNIRGYEVVPIPGAVWLFGSGLLGLVGLRKKFKGS